MQERYYQLLDAELAVAEAPGHVLGTRYLLENIDDWSPVTLHLVSGTAQDYIESDAGWPIVSSRMQVLLAEGVGPQDDVRWLPVELKSASGERLPYFVCVSFQQDSLLHPDSYKDGKMVVWILSRERVAGRAVFSAVPRKASIFIAGAVKRRLETSGCTGFECAPVPVR
jgi:hypothetical protein